MHSCIHFIPFHYKIQRYSRNIGGQFRNYFRYNLISFASGPLGAVYVEFILYGSPVHHHQRRTIRMTSENMYYIARNSRYIVPTT